MNPSDEQIADAAVQFRDSLVTKADQMVHGVYPLWHGWALYEAFIAGARFALKSRDAAGSEVKE